MTLFSWFSLGAVIVIYDDGCAPYISTVRRIVPARSVTNDAEEVIDRLVAKGVDFSDKRVIYRDSTGRWDEMRIGKDSRFAGFVPNGATSLAEALVKMGAVQSIFLKSEGAEEPFSPL